MGECYMHVQTVEIVDSLLFTTGREREMIFSATVKFLLKKDRQLSVM